MKTKNTYFISSYDKILEALKNKEFYIFGNTRLAQIFYLYCKEKDIAKNVKAFILSDLSKLNRKMNILHGIPIKSVEWFKTQEDCDVFLGAKEKTVVEQLLPMLQGQIDGDIYYTSNFVISIWHLVMR